MTATRTARRLAAVAILTATVWTLQGPAAPAAPYEAHTCTTVDADAADDATVSAALAQGWAGRADDGAEILYSPSCTAPVQ